MDINELKRCSTCKCMKLLKFYSIRENTGQMLKTCISCREKFKCESCEYKCSDKCILKQHIKAVHDKIKDFKCELCDYKYSDKGNLKQHIKQIHDKIKDFECESCDYKCSDKGSLQQHKKSVHDKIKDVECESCDYKCSSKGNLQQHIKIVHDKIKDVECESCDYKCSTNNELKTHKKRVHDKIKDFECESCNYKCSTNSHLQRHMKAVHDKIKDFECESCNYKCSDNSALQRHIKICTTELHISGGELGVMKALEILNIEYKREISPMKEHSKQRFDFEIKINDEIRYIEFDGQQHYIPVCFGGISKEDANNKFEKQKKHDNIKNEWCKVNKFKLLRICYKDFDNIFEIIKDFIN